MRLTRIRLRDWMPFADVDLDLSDTDSVVVVGENGAGKSALLDAITWAIYDRTRQPGGGEGSSPDKLIHEGADSALVEISWQTGGRTITLTRERYRGREGKLRLAVDGIEESHHTVADTRAAAIRYAGLAFGPMLAGPLMVQAGLYPKTVADSLLRAEPSARKDIMLDVFGSADWQPLHEEAKAQRDIAQLAVGAADRRIAELEQQAEGEEQLRIRLTAAQSALADTEATIASLDEQISAVRERAAVVNAKAERLSGLKRDIELRLTSIRSDQQALERQEHIITAAKTAMLTPEPTDEAPDASVYDEQIAALRAGVADAQRARVDLTEQNGLAAAATSRIRAFEQAAAQYEATVATVPCGAAGKFAACRFLTAKPDPASVAADVNALPIYTKAVEDLRPVVDDYERRAQSLAELEVEQRRVAVQAERVASAKREWATKRDTAKQTIATAQIEVDRLTERISEATQRAAELSHERDQLAAEAGEVEHLGHEQARLAAARATAVGAKQEAEKPVRQLEVEILSVQRAQQALRATQGERAASRENVRVYTDLAAAFHRDGVPTMLIEEALPQIEAHANDVLGHMPGDLRVSLVTGRLTNAGTISDRLDVVVSDAGYERDHVMLSIGQRFRVDLALRVALGRVLSHRSGVNVRTLWLDEPLAALDTRARQAVIETLNAVAPEFGLIVVVSHADDINDAFPSRILVERQGATSTAVLV